MADILRVTTPLVNKSQMVETKQNVDLASQFPIQDPTRVARPGAQSELLGQNNGMLQQEETSALLLSLLKDPSVTVNFLKSISSMEAVIKLLPVNNSPFTKEIEQMFGELLNYKSIEYYRTHPLISYDSVYYEGMYKIFGVVVCKKDDPDFLYHSFIDKDNDQEMVEFVTKIRERSILNTKVDVRTDDKLLTLSTCDYTFKSETGERIARFVVFARKVREGESTDVDVAGATINTNPVMPAEWYSYLKKQQEAELKKQQEAAAALANNKWLTESERSTLTAEEANSAKAYARQFMDIVNAANMAPELAEAS